MKKIENMTVNEIISIIGFNLTRRDIEEIFNRDADAIYEFNEKLSKIKVRNRTVSINKEDISTFNGREFNALERREALGKMGNKVNKYTLVLLTMYNYQKELESTAKNPQEQKRYLEAKIRAAIELIENRDFTIVEPVFAGRYITELRVINSTRIIQNIKKGSRIDDLNRPSKKQLARLAEIQEKVGIENVVMGLLIEDIVGSTTDLKVGKSMMYQISWNALHRYAESHPEIDLDEILRSETVPDDLEEKLYQSHEIRSCMRESIEQNCRYIDFNRLLFMSWERSINLLERDIENNLRCKAIEEDGEEREEGKEGTVNGIREIIENIQKTIEKGTEIKMGDTVYTVKDIERSLKRFKEGRYIRSDEIREAKMRMLSGETSLMGEDDEVLSVMKLNEGEAEILIKSSEENIFFLVSKGIIEEEEIKPALYIRGECSSKLFSFINRKGILKYEDMLELFEAGIINNEMVLSIEDEEIKQRLKEDTNRKIQELYLAVLDKENDKHKETMERFSKYAVLYKRLNIDGKTEEEVLDAAFSLISSFEENLTDEVLQGLYQFGIIPLEAAADWGANLTKMLSSNSIKPTDMKDLVAKKVISIDAIKNVLRNGELSYEEKLDLIYSTFDGETEAEIAAREELMDFLGIGESHKADGVGETKITRGEGAGIKAKEFITDPHARWKLISLLDKDYSKKFLPEGKEVIDGHRVFLLPNNEKILIERMHEKRAGKRVSAYGSATYIMNTDKFFENIDTIIVDGAINRTFLRELSEGEEATKIIHSKHWGAAIKRYFDITSENEKYTEADIVEIDTAIANVEKSRKER